MSNATGVALIVVGFGGLLLVGFVLRRRLPPAAGFVLLAAFSVAAGAGALVVQDHVTTADWIVTLTAAALLGPAHLRFLAGPFGPTAGPGTAAAEPV